MQTFVIHNTKTKQAVEITAIDGHSALQVLKAMPIYATGIKAPYNYWSMAIKCDCGKVTSYSFCSVTCYEKRGTNA